VTRIRRLLLGAITALTAAAGVMHFGDAPPVPSFVVAGLALAGIAWVVSFATEEVGERFGAAATGVLQSTLGNLPEFFVVVFALSAGEVVVAQFSIIGSIFSNALLVLGLVIVAGAWRTDDGVMRFSARLPMDTTTLLLLTSFIIVLVGLAGETHDAAADDVGTISVIAAILLLGTYVVWVFGYLRSEGERGGASGHASGALPLRVSVTLLAASGVGAAFVSEWFVDALRPTIDQIGLSPEFAGLVVVAIAGNAVEHAVGIVLAAKGEADLAVSVVKNSVAQVAAFLWPALVLVSLLFVHRLTFDIAILYVGALLLTTLSVWQVTGDGEATLFEGAALVATYVVLAVFTLYE
jgi:Ca2+:H+ antiporter